jgi:hypothetical protein
MIKSGGGKMTIEKSSLKTEAVFSENKEHRYLLKKEWDKNKKKAMIIMINPSTADSMLIDRTTMYVINNLSQLGYGSVDILNAFSKISTKISLSNDMDDLVTKENDVYVQKSATKADSIIIAWGSKGRSNGKMKIRRDEIFKILEEHKAKLFVIKDSNGKVGLHPLSPSIAKCWELEKLNI